MTEQQYQILLNLYHNYHSAFEELSEKTKTEFFAKLYYKERI